jgi:hypothetical protein
MRAACFAAIISDADATISEVESATANRQMRHQNAPDCFAVARQLSDPETAAGRGG